MNNLKHIGLAIFMYVQNFDGNVPIGDYPIGQSQDWDKFCALIHYTNTAPRVWVVAPFGKLYQTGYIKDGKIYYCPSVTYQKHYNYWFPIPLKGELFRKYWPDPNIVPTNRVTSTYSYNHLAIYWSSLPLATKLETIIKFAKNDPRRIAVSDGRAMPTGNWISFYLHKGEGYNVLTWNGSVHWLSGNYQSSINCNIQSDAALSPFWDWAGKQVP
ncbi:MAG: hypothetical protein NC921_03500 [Candidatus Omnitrophica bacterium]|nr:hypothetical protein [Candidatus Omnitrophota bacterium]